MGSDRTATIARRFASFAAALVAVAVLAWLVLPGIRWGLPSEERNRLTMGDDRNAWHGPKMPAQETESPWEYYPNNLAGGPARTGSTPRSAFNVLRSYHPDEYVFLKSLSAMRPAKFKLFPGFFAWPALQFYVSGVALKVASWFGAVTLVRDMDFYFLHPEAAARLYEVGRLVTFLFAVGCILVLWRAAGRLFGPWGAAAAALLLAVTPLFTINARYWTADVPMLFWMSLAFLFSTHIFSGGGRKWYVLAGVALGLAAATRYQGGAAAFLLAAAHAMRSDAGTGLRERARRFFGSKEIWLAAALSVVVFLVCNPYILIKPAQFAQEFSDELKASHGDWSQFDLVGPLSALTGLGILFVAAVLAAFGLALVRRDRAIWFVVFGFGLPALILFLGRPMMARYWMPVLLLPVLLVAWAFATMQRRGMDLRKRGAKVAMPIMLIIVLLASGLQSVTFAQLYTDPKYDTRTRAGEWIAENIPAGSSIGVLSEPWQFEVPPMDSRKFKIVIMDALDSGLGHPTQSADYFVISELQIQPKDSEKFIAEYTGDLAIIEGSLLVPYHLKNLFYAWQGILDWLTPNGPQDLRYTSPVILVEKREP